VPSPLQDYSPEACKEVGAWAGALVRAYLRDQLPSGFQVVGTSEAQKAGYDIKVLNQFGEDHAYIVVKGSAARERALFVFSHKEWSFARRKGSAYHIYRVDGVGSRDASIALIKDPYSQWQAHKGEMRLAL
jgi:hypothetical protein